MRKRSHAYPQSKQGISPIRPVFSRVRISSPCVFLCRVIAAGQIKPQATVLNLSTTASGHHPYRFFGRSSEISDPIFWTIVHANDRNPMPMVFPLSRSDRADRGLGWRIDPPCGHQWRLRLNASLAVLLAMVARTAASSSGVWSASASAFLARARACSSRFSSISRSLAARSVRTMTFS